MRKLWKTPEQLWTDEESQYAQSMEACARVIGEFLLKGGKP